MKSLDIEELVDVILNKTIECNIFYNKTINDKISCIIFFQTNNTTIKLDCGTGDINCGNVFRLDNEQIKLLHSIAHSFMNNEYDRIDKLVNLEDKELKERQESLDHFVRYIE